MTAINQNEQIAELRKLFLDKLSTADSDLMAQVDIDRVKTNDTWILRFLEQNDFIMKDSINQLWTTCEWRKKKAINDICTDNIRMDYMHEAVFFPHNVDCDNKRMLIFETRRYIRGSRVMEDTKRCLLYWIERMHRETNYDQLTVVFDMQETGLSNMDMDFTKYIIDVFKYYYPNSLNYILIYEMPWILNATFQIIKKLLPAKAVARMKFINKKNITDFIPPDQLLKSWGGNDDYRPKFMEEKVVHANGISKKVTFAENMSQSESPMSETIPSNFPNELMKVLPGHTIVFTKTETDINAIIDITNIGDKPITYKVKTTSPEKFRVRPSNGVLKPGDSSIVNIVLLQGQHLSSIARDKFLVMSMPYVEDPNIDVPELWKNTPPNSPEVEQHRLRCSIHGAHGDGSHTSFASEDRSIVPSLSQIAETTNRIERGIHFNRTLQFISIILFVFLAIAIVYILKLEIRNSSQCSSFLATPSK